ncbi:nicotinate-nucleotide--dimethylbenzimidazole phosphoribosyltransferase [Haloferacaceae archaeon DSL9]
MGADPPCADVPRVDERAREAAAARQGRLTKPPGSLGRLESLAVDIAGMQATESPSVDPAVVVTMAGDHGVAEEGVSAYPQSATAAMVANLLDGGAAVNALTGVVGAETLVVDMGVAGSVPDAVVDKRIGPGTANIALEPAMSRDEALASIAAGRAVVADHAADARLIGLGEMGIANTTPSAAVTAVLTGERPATVTGRGTGVDDETWAHKVDVVERAIETTGPDPSDPVDVLRRVGGFELGGLAGVAIEAAARRMPVVVDGFITGAAALLAVACEPRVEAYLLPSHASVEPGHAIQQDALGLEPLFDYEMRLGEGTGAALAIGTYDAACAALTEMATFEEAGVSEE